MAKKKEETNEYELVELQKQLNAHAESLAKILAQLTQHEQTHDNFRTSFRNLENNIIQLKERNRLR